MSEFQTNKKINNYHKFAENEFSEWTQLLKFHINENDIIQPFQGCQIDGNHFFYHGFAPAATHIQAYQTYNHESG
jgi:hypothetical protein